MKLRRDFGVATGQSRYPTPLGKWEVVVKWRNPWWVQLLASDRANDAEPIPLVLATLLGTRWMGLSAPAVGIHGTPDPASIGYSVSDGSASGCGSPRSSGSSRRSTSEPSFTSCNESFASRRAGRGRCGRGGAPGGPACREARSGGRAKSPRRSSVAAHRRRRPGRLNASTARVTRRSTPCAAKPSSELLGLLARCRDEMPLLQQGRSGCRGKDVVFVGIDAKDVRGDARKSCSLSRHVSERLRRQGIDDRALRRHRLPRDALIDKTGRCGITSPGRSWRQPTSTTGSSARWPRREGASSRCWCCASQARPPRVS